MRDGHVLVVRRALPPASGRFSLPGGVVEAGESLHQALVREVQEETSLVIEPVALAGWREVIARDAGQRVERHFVILAFAARWLAGEPALNDELAEARWVTRPSSRPADHRWPRRIVAAAFERLDEAS